MNNHKLEADYRRYRAYVSSYNVNILQNVNPWLPAWWSAAFPGLGHLMMGMYLKGFILFIWEYFINLNANINLAILYSFTGRFELAKDVVDIKWVLLYMPIYVVSIWDSYRLSVDVNKLSYLSVKENAPIVPFKLSAFSLNYLDKRSPVLASFWSLITPGLGHLYVHRLPTGFFLLAWSITTIYFSNSLIAIHHSVLGNFSIAIESIKADWFLFLPSIYLFSMYDSYRIAQICNKLFKDEQTMYFKKNYQKMKLKIPILK